MFRPFIILCASLVGIAAWATIEKQKNGVKTILLLRLPTAGATELVVVPQPEE